jgi:hypothetical protein
MEPVPEPFIPSGHWSTVPLRHGLHLSAHEDLPIARVERGGSSDALIGIAVDPSEPDRTEPEIVKRLTTSAPDLPTLIGRTAPLAGRWVWIHQDAANTYLFTDPCGFRQVYFHSHAGWFWCGSGPDIIDAACPLTPTADGDLTELVSSPRFARRQFALVGDLTPYRDCRHLLPNHYLSAEPHAVVRFYPAGPTAPRSISQATDAAVPILQGILEGLTARHSVSLAVTAGRDSRVLVAASKAVRRDVEYFVYADGLVPPGSADSWVPQALSRHLDLGLVLRDCAEEPPEWFVTALSRNVTFGRTPSRTRTVWDKLKRGDERVNINGNGSEICRSFFDRYGKRGTRDQTGADLAAVMGYQGIPYAEHALDAWVDGVRHLTSEQLALLDLLYWEQRLGNWGARYPAEQDIACDEVSPFNCRSLIEILASAPRQARVAPGFLLHRSLVARMWPEALDVPINPLAPGDVVGRATRWIRPHVPESLVDIVKKTLAGR